MPPKFAAKAVDSCSIYCTHVKIDSEKLGQDVSSEFGNVTHRFILCSLCSAFARASCCLPGCFCCCVQLVGRGGIHIFDD